MIEDLRQQLWSKSFDMLPVYHASIEDLDSKKIDDFLKTRKGFTLAHSRDALLLSYHLKVEEHGHYYPTGAGILAFGKNPQQFFPQAFIICSHFEGISGRNAFASQDCTGTVIEQFYQAYNFIVNRLSKSFTIKGPKRIEELELPQEAIREILVNAIVHRSYNIQAPTKIAIFDNRVEIFTPGNFPGPITIANLCAGLTYIRNTALAKILRHAGLIETLGTGFQTLFESYAQKELPTPEVIEGENYVKCILPRRSASHNGRQAHNLDSDAQRILHLFVSGHEISMAAILKNTNLARATAGRKLKQLIEQGFIKQIGVGKVTRYIKN